MKFFIYFLLIMAGGIGIYYFTPVKIFADNVTDQTRAFLTLAISGRKEQVRSFIDDKVLPKDPEEERSALIEKLKNNFEKIKNNKLTANNVAIFKDSETTRVGDSSADENNSGEAVKDLIKDSEEIINQLGSANENKTAAQTAVDRILDIVLPIKETAIDCKQ